MPSIPEEDRQRASVFPKTPGELNYAITQLAYDYLYRQGLCYNTLNEIMGAMAGAQAEFYRRAAAGYEDDAAFRNGDIRPA